MGCELQGIALSSEIQSAARRVAEENKKLRALSAQHGIRDRSIKAYLQTPCTADTLIGGQYGSHSEAVQALEQSLSRRKPCCTDGTEPSGGGQSYDRGFPEVSPLRSLRGNHPGMRYPDVFLDSNKLGGWLQ